MDEYIVLALKTTGDNPYFDTVCGAGMVRYKDHAEVSRSFFNVRENDINPVKNEEKTYSLAEARDAIVNFVKDKKVLLYGQAAFLQAMFYNCPQEYNINVIDCENYLFQTVPALKGYARGRLEELFHINEPKEGIYRDCSVIQKLFRLALLFSKGKSLHDFVYDVERYFSGYWEKKAVIDRYAKLAIFCRKKVVLAGEFRALPRDSICKVVEASRGTVSAYPDEATEVAVVGNTEFPAPFQTKALHETLIRVRQNQSVRIISELELLSLLHGQYVWDKRVNPYYLPVSGKPMVFPVKLGNLGSFIKNGTAGFPAGQKKDAANSRGMSKKAASSDKLIDAIKSAL